MDSSQLWHEGSVSSQYVSYRAISCTVTGVHAMRSPSHRQENELLVPRWQGHPVQGILENVITVLISFTCFSIVVCMSKSSAPFTCKFLTFVPDSTFCIPDDSMAVEGMSKFAFLEHKSVSREKFIVHISQSG